jgi:hypothetical protein
MDTSLKRRLPAWLQGTIVGVVYWVIALVGAYALETNTLSFPRWMEKTDLADSIGSMIMIIAAPIAAGGWLMIWGDGPQPPAWLTSATFNICFAICFYAILGGMIGQMFSKKWPHQFTTIRLTLLVVIAVSLIGILPLLWEQLV